MYNRITKDIYNIVSKYGVECCEYTPQEARQTKADYINNGYLVRIEKRRQPLTFKEWAQLDEDDTRTLHIIFNGKAYTSNDTITGLEMERLQKAVLKSVKLVNNEWLIEL